MCWQSPFEHVVLTLVTSGLECLQLGRRILPTSVAYRGGWFGMFKPPPPRNSEDIGGVLDRMSKKNRRLDFLLQFTVFSYGCNLLNKGFF